jgi:hypothetical protein
MIPFRGPGCSLRLRSENSTTRNTEATGLRSIAAAATTAWLSLREYLGAVREERGATLTKVEAPRIKFCEQCTSEDQPTRRSGCEPERREKTCQYFFARTQKEIGPGIMPFCLTRDNIAAVSSRVVGAGPYRFDRPRVRRNSFQNELPAQAGR